MMNIKSITLYNFRGIENLCLPLDEHLTVIAAVNGGGKTTVLNALAMLLSWLTARTKRDAGQGRQISEPDIQNGTKYSELVLQTSLGEWSITKQRKGTNREVKGNLVALVGIVSQLRHHLETDKFLPVFASYSVDRAVQPDDFPKRIRTKHEFDSILLYDEFPAGTANFRRFFEWFREREDIENESRRYTNSLFPQAERVEFPDRQLQAVRNALKRFLPEYTDFMIKRQPLRMVVTKENQELKIDSLSTGETCFIALIGDIARRLAIANPERLDPLEGDGIILIDEIDLHLHPAWQRRAITKLPEVFPNVQFVVTTHSPQILSEVSPDLIRLLYKETDGIKFTIPKQSIGLNSAQILQELMNDSGINISVSQRLEQIAERIDRDEFIEAKQLIAQLKEELHGTIPDIVEAEATIAMLEPEEGAGV